MSTGETKVYKNREFKALLILFFAIVSISVLGTHVLNGIFPSLPLAIVSLSLIFLVGIYRFNATYYYLFPIVMMSVFIRVYIFAFPDSLIGMDPDSYAVWIRQILLDGSVEAMNLNFYENAPFFHVFGGSFSLISGLNVPDSLVIYPLVTGLLYPIIVFILAEKIGGVRIALVSSVLASVAATSVHFAFWPIAQSLAFLLWIIFILALVKYVETFSRFLFIIIISMVIGMAFTHKLPVLVSFFTMAGLTTLLYITDFETRIFQNFNANYLTFGVSLVLISGLLLYLQWIHITDFIDTVINRGTQALYYSELNISAPLGFPTAAYEPMAGLKGIILRNMHAFTLIPIGGVSWLYLFYKKRHNNKVLVLLAGAAISVLLIVIGLFNPERIRPLRSFFFAELILVVIIPTFLTKKDLNKIIKYGFLILIFIIIVSQAFSTLAVPAYPNSPRYYLTTAEIEGKEFGHNFVYGTIHTDYYYDTEFIPSQVQFAARYRDYHKYRTLDRALLYHNNSLNGYDYISYRTNVDVYRTPIGLWRLTWNPEEMLKVNYNRIYSNPDVSVFKN